MKPKILFVLPYPLDTAPSQRFRVEQFLPLLDEAGITYKLAPFMSKAVWSVLYKDGFVVKKISGLLWGYIKRLIVVITSSFKYDYIFIHREAAPLGPPVFEWLLAKFFKKKMIYDFDDAIWLPNTSTENKMAAYFKANWKVGKICKWSTTVTAGNQYLADYAKASGAHNVVIIPTVVETEKKYLPKKTPGNAAAITVGWTGSHSTLKYLETIEPVIRKLQQRHRFTFLVIADKCPNMKLPYFEFIKWNAATEINDLEKIDIGVMPLLKDAWSEGKCGFKLIQYMAMQIPAIASPVGVNAAIMQNGVEGILADTEQDWERAIEHLLLNADERKTMGINARKRIENNYSIASQKNKFLALFKE